MIVAYWLAIKEASLPPVSNILDDYPSYKYYMYEDFILQNENIHKIFIYMYTHSHERERERERQRAREKERVKCLKLVSELQQAHHLLVYKRLAQRWHATVRRRILRCSARSIQNAGSHRYAHGASIHTYASVHTQPLLQAHR